MVIGELIFHFKILLILLHDVLYLYDLKYGVNGNIQCSKNIQSESARDTTLYATTIVQVQYTVLYRYQVLLSVLLEYNLYEYSTV